VITLPHNPRIVSIPTDRRIPAGRIIWIFGTPSNFICGPVFSRFGKDIALKGQHSKQYNQHLLHYQPSSIKLI
jgi:hypothetical protein